MCTLAHRRRTGIHSIVVFLAGLSLLAGCTTAATTTTASQVDPRPTPAATSGPTSSTAIAESVESEPAETDPVEAEPADVELVEGPQPTGLSEPVLISDGTTISRVQPDGTTEELYRAESFGNIYDFASDGSGGVFFQEDNEFKENDYIAWLVDGEVSYPVVAEVEIQLDLVGVIGAGDAPRLLYQRIDSCCGALESMGTLRIFSPENGADRAIRQTGAWETSTDFSALTVATAFAVHGAHEASTLMEIDPVTGETLTAVDVGNLFGAAVVSDEHFLLAHVVGGEDEAALTLSEIDEFGEATVLFSMNANPAAHVVDAFVDGRTVVISRQYTGVVQDESPAVVVVDLAEGTGRELDIRGIARPDRLPMVDAVGSGLQTRTFDELSFGGVAFDGFRLGMSRQEIVESLGEPAAATEFVWGGGLIGYTLDYGDIMIEIHYDVSLLAVRRADSCTAAGVCIGGTFTSVERAYGFGHVATVDLGPDETRQLHYDLPDGGYCDVVFTFGRNEAGGAETLQEIKAACLPD